MSDQAQRLRRALESLVGVPATEGNRVDVLRNGDQIFPAMLDAIRAAQRTVDLTTYVYWTGDVAVRFADALAERAAAGVRVRVLLDAVGALQMNRDLLARMEDAGALVEWFRVPGRHRLGDTGARTHRKVLVCDEEVAFVGGVGIAKEWEGDARSPEEWRDTHFRIRGPAVDGVRGAFVSNWAETERPMFSAADRFPEQPRAGDSTVQVVSCAAQVGWSDMATVVTALIALADDHVRLTSAYFVPDEALLATLCEATGRGVRVDVLMPGEHTDKRVVQAAGEADYTHLLDAGVNLWRYRPTMLHAKVLTVDGLAACIGSANFDVRSLRLNDETNAVVFDQEVVGLLDAHFAEDLANAERVDPEVWSRRGPVQRVAEKVTGLFDDQL